jgi:hypothetical protein
VKYQPAPETLPANFVEWQRRKALVAEIQDRILMKATDDAVLCRYPEWMEKRMAEHRQMVKRETEDLIVNGRELSGRVMRKIIHDSCLLAAAARRKNQCTV